MSTTHTEQATLAVSPPRKPDAKEHGHRHSHDITLGGRNVHDELWHSHSHNVECNEHHGYWEEPAT